MKRDFFDPSKDVMYFVYVGRSTGKFMTSLWLFRGLPHGYAIDHSTSVTPSRSAWGLLSLVTGSWRYFGN